MIDSDVYTLLRSHRSARPCGHGESPNNYVIFIYFLFLFRFFFFFFVWRSYSVFNVQNNCTVQCDTDKRSKRLSTISKNYICDITDLSRVRFFFLLLF